VTLHENTAMHDLQWYLFLIKMWKIPKTIKVFNTDIFSVASHSQEMRKSLYLIHDKDSKGTVVNQTLPFLHG